jgi:ABC-2 type transport system ATP-binding protein
VVWTANCTAEGSIPWQNFNYDKSARFISLPCETSNHLDGDVVPSIAQLMQGAAPLVEIDNLSKVYGSFEAVKDVSLSVSAGKIFALLGPNGAGKTTTIRMLMGILVPTSGTARINGLDCFQDRVEVKRRVGYLPDEPVFYDYLRGSEIIRFSGEMHGLSRQDIATRTESLITRLELSDALEEFAVNYSKGMKKKLALVCAMLHDPALLILDEPTNGLDPFATRVLHELIREKAAAGKTIFFSTHLLDQAEKLCSQIAIVAKGRLAAHGTLEELRARVSSDSSLEEIFFSVAGESNSVPTS